MRASGGTIFGNCAIGSETSATAPTTTVMIAMTIATMGRLMKNFDTERLFCGFRGRERDGVHEDALADLLSSVHHDPVAGMQPGLHDDVVTDLGARRHCHDMRVVARIDCGQLVSALQLGQRPLGHYQRALLGVN